MDNEQVLRDDISLKDSVVVTENSTDVSNVDVDGDPKEVSNSDNFSESILSGDDFSRNEFSNVNQNAEVVSDDFSKPEFSNGNENVNADNHVDNETESIEASVQVKPKKRINVTLIVIVGIVILFGGVMLLMNQGTSGNNNFQGENVREEQEEKIVVNTGTDWGNLYLTYMISKKPDLLTYEISFIDTNKDNIPEMLLKYKDNNDVDTLKMLYIVDDEVYETKYYHNYKIRYIYSLQSKESEWYIFISTNKNYGTYTMIKKIIDKMAFDADIKTTNDTELIDYGKKYFDSDYKLVFYTVKEGQHEKNYRTFITKYDTYAKQIEDTHNNLYEKYKGVVVTGNNPTESDNVTFGGKQFYYGDYYASIPATEEGVFAHTAVLTFNKNKTLIVEGILYNYEYKGDGNYLQLYSDNKEVGTVTFSISGIFIFNGIEYSYNK